MALLVALLLILILSACWAITLFGMPGNWLMVIITAVYACLVPVGWRVAVGWKLVLLLVVLAGLGELIELLAGAAGATRAGGSKRGAALALLGSILGAVVGIFVGLPVPLVGSILAALLFAGLGAMAGAIVGEVWAGRDLPRSWRIGKAAFRGRLIGTLAKMIVGGVMVAAVVVALVR